MKDVNNNLEENGDKVNVYKVFYHEKATFLLVLRDNQIDLSKIKMKFSKFNLSIKNEFHFTIIGNKVGKKILDLISHKNNSSLASFGKLIQQANFDVHLIKDFYYIKKEYEDGEIRESIIQIAKIDGLDEFYEKLNNIFGISFDRPFPHLTLYTVSSVKENQLRGIGIYSEKEFEELQAQKI